MLVSTLVLLKARQMATPARFDSHFLHRFQLADLNCEGVSAGEYAAFIYKLSDAICLPGGGYRDEQVAAL